jgi:hypothetical protein
VLADVAAVVGAAVVAGAVVGADGGVVGDCGSTKVVTGPPPA